MCHNFCLVINIMDKKIGLSHGLDLAVVKAKAKLKSSPEIGIPDYFVVIINYVKAKQEKFETEGDEV